MAELHEATLSLETEKPAWKGKIDLPVLQPAIRSTNINTLETCPRKFLWAHRYGLVGKGYVPALAIGELFHLIEERLYLGDTEIEASAVADQFVEDYVAALHKDALPGGLLQNGKFVIDIERQMREDLLKAEAMARALWRLYPLDTAKWEVVAVEKLARLRLLRPRIESPIRSRLDLVLRDKRTDEHWIVDHKTTGFDTRSRAATFTFDSQARLYRLQFMGLYPGKNLVGILHNVVQKPSIKYCSKDADFEAYINRVAQWYSDKMESPDPPILQSFVRFSEPPMVPEFLGKLQRTDAACRLPEPTLDEFPRNTGACLIMGKPCPFLRLCSSDPAMLPDLLGAYRQVNRDEEELLDSRNDETYTE